MNGLEPRGAEGNFFKLRQGALSLASRPIRNVSQHL